MADRKNLGNVISFPEAKSRGIPRARAEAPRPLQDRLVSEIMRQLDDLGKNPDPTHPLVGWRATTPKTD